MRILRAIHYTISLLKSLKESLMFDLDPKPFLATYKRRTIKTSCLRSIVLSSRLQLINPRHPIPHPRWATILSIVGIDWVYVRDRFESWGFYN